MVRMKGIEPPRLAALDPKSSASTNFATSANSSSLNGLQIYYFLIKSSFSMVNLSLFCAKTNRNKRNGNI